ncbi:MAG: condensation domain-containing protein, partial [Steroidobacteraceae bacterium]
VGGPQVARGYLNRPELTAERFVPDRFGGPAGARMYRTGDLGRWLADGTIEYQGRDDGQVKIRGFRIELGEIEARLLGYRGIREAVVVAREEEGTKRLVAYYTLAGAGGPLQAMSLREHMQAGLPEYMVPAAYVWLESLPVTPSGKVDRRALPQPTAHSYAARAYEAPQGELEETIARVWAEVLKIEPIGRSDNFFQLGGHSLLLVKIIERLRHHGISVEAGSFYAQPTLNGLAATARESQHGAEEPPPGIPAGCEQITPAMLPLAGLETAQIAHIVRTVPGGVSNIQDIYPLSPLQEGMLYHHLTNSDGDPYVMSTLLRFDSQERLDAYVGALQQITQRHDILRTAFCWEGLDRAVQVVLREARISVEVIACEAADTPVANQLIALHDWRRYQFDLRRAPLHHLY